MNTRGRIKVCRFCEDKALKVDYKDERMLRRFVSERGKVHSPTDVRNLCASSTQPGDGD